MSSFRLGKFHPDVSVGGQYCYQRLDKDIFQILTPFFEYNRHIHTVSLGSLDMSLSLDSLILALSKCKELKCFHVVNINCAKYQHAERLFGALSKKGLVELRFFDFRSDFDWRECTALANLITTSATSMRALELIGGRFDYAGFSILGNALLGCKTLEQLGLKFISIKVLDPPRVHWHWGLTDKCAIGLGDYLAGVDTLKSLDLGTSCSYIISVSGWRGLVKCLRNVNSSLYSLDLQKCGMNDARARAIVSALSGNSCLRELCLLKNERITDNIWDDILNMLCDRTSVGSIMYSSNHTLQSILIDLPIPAAVASLLAMNHNEDRSGAIRGKLLKYHFSDRGDGNKCTNIFAQMSESMMPIALEWIGRNRFGFSLMYEFVQMGPAIFDITHGQQIVNA